MYLFAKLFSKIVLGFLNKSVALFQLKLTLIIINLIYLKELRYHNILVQIYAVELAVGLGILVAFYRLRGSFNFLFLCI